MKTFFMVKPDGVKRNIVGQVIDRVEQEGFKITKMKMMTITTCLLYTSPSPRDDVISRMPSSA